MHSAITASTLEVADLWHRYAELDIVSGVSFDVRAGEIVCLLGQSGSGKTTVLRLIAGLERPQAGRISLNGRVLTAHDHFVPPEDRNVGLMFQDYALFPHLSLIENVMFGLAAKPRSEALDLAVGLLQRVGLGSRSRDYPHMLSGGEQQRLTLARTLAPGPCAILMDEPFSNLDQRLRHHMREMTLSLLRERNISAIIVTHDPDETMLIADRVILLEHGRALQIGTPEQLYTRPVSLFAARFFSELNEVPATCHNQQATCQLGRFPAPGVADGAAIVCFRPHALSVITTAAETEATIEARVTDCRFVGDGYWLTLDVTGMGAPIRACLAPASGPLEPGHTVRVGLAPGLALVFSVDPTGK